MLAINASCMCSVISQHGRSGLSLTAYHLRSLATFDPLTDLAFPFRIPFTQTHNVGGPLRSAFILPSMCPVRVKFSKPSIIIIFTKNLSMYLFCRSFHRCLRDPIYKILSIHRIGSILHQHSALFYSFLMNFSES